ncbi:glycosyltransferase [Rubrivivax sp. A210]|uniref:CgeB family protein n=1 Tax=Rubrivivax sp. A210 TaxID=2772301 RepID=UPI001F3D1FE9|nr:glycosyltransferase [Rubrivivax sp. A210]
MSILYLGTGGGTSRDRANAYRRMGHEVLHLDPRSMLPASVWIDRLLWRVGGGLLSHWTCKALAARLAGTHYDLCHVDSGEYITPAALGLLRRHCAKVISYNIDDPYGPRDGRRFAAYRAAVPHYDLVVVVRALNVPEARALGARHVIRVNMSADELKHAPLVLSEADRAEWASEVLFIGTWMPERGPFLAELLRLGVPLTIRGARWQRAPEWPQLAAAYRGPAVFGADYAKAIQGARINIGLLSKENRDLHTTRSLEIPALGSLLCAERTPDHKDMYSEGREAVFWADAAECARQCLELLADESRRAAMAAAGQRRVHANRDFNEPMLEKVLGALRAASA